MKIIDFFTANRRIRTSLLIGFMVFIILPALVVGIFSFVQSKNVIQQSVFNTLGYLTDAQENAIVNWTIGRKNFLEGLAQNERIQKMEYDFAARILDNSLNMDKNFRALVLADANGKIIVDSLYRSEIKNLSVVDREYFKQALTGKTYVNEVLLSRNSNEPVLIIATPVRQNDGSVVGVLFGAINIEVITGLVQQNFPGNKGESYLVSQQGLMISQSKYLQEHTSFKITITDTPATYLSKGQSGEDIYNNYLNKKVFGVYRWLPEMKMGLVVEKEYFSALLEYGLKTYLYVVLISALTILLFIIFRVLYSRRLSIPLERLAKEVNSIAEGNFRSVLSIQANKEVEELANAINHMSSNLMEKTNQLNNLIEQLEQYTDYLKNEKNQLARISITDELTGLYNRRYLNQELERLIHLSSTLKKNVSLLMLDLDRFKYVNDTYGHATGDVALKEFAQLLRGCSRGSDVIGRFGGEEFMIVVPFVGGRQAREIAERIRHDVENFIFDSEEHKIRITVSIGIATLTPSPEESIRDVAEKLLKTADDCLYDAKESGRNRVVQVNLNKQNPLAV